MYIKASGLTRALVVVALLQFSGFCFGSTNAPVKYRISKTIVVSGSNMQNEKWHSTHIPLSKDDSVMIAVVPMEGLNASKAYQSDALVFRVGPTGAEHFVDSNGRAAWCGEKEIWHHAPTRTFKADMDGELYYIARQKKKFSCKIMVE